MASKTSTVSTTQTRGRGAANKNRNTPQLSQPTNDAEPQKSPKKRLPKKNKNVVELKDVTCQTDIFDKADKIANINQESEMNGLRLENCFLKNLNDDLTKQLEQGTSKVNGASQHIKELNKKLETVSAQLKMSQDIINHNNKLKLDNEKLQMKISDAEKAVFRCEELQSKMDCLQKKVQNAEKVVLENASLKKEVESLKMENVISKESLKNLKDILGKTSHNSGDKADEPKSVSEQNRKKKRKENFDNQMLDGQEQLKKTRLGANPNYFYEFHENTNHSNRLYPNRNNTEDRHLKYGAVRPQDNYFIPPNRDVYFKKPQNQSRNAPHHR